MCSISRNNKFLVQNPAVPKMWIMQTLILQKCNTVHKSKSYVLKEKIVLKFSRKSELCSKNNNFKTFKGTF